MKDPAILLYTGDFLNGCTGLTMEERGQYITLLCLQHQTGHLSEKTIRLSLGNVSVDVMKKFETDENGLFFNRRMDEEIQKRSQFLDTRRVNGKKGGRPKGAKKPLAKPLAKPNGKPNEKLIEDENINDNINIFSSDFKDQEIEQISILTFDEFWDMYDKKVGDKTKLRKKYETISEADREKIHLHVPQYRLATPDKKFRKDPQTYLNNQSWNDEIIQSNGANRKNNTAIPSEQEQWEYAAVIAKHFPGTQ